MISTISERYLARQAMTGALVLGCGVWLAPIRVWANLLVAAYFLLTLSLGGALFLALTAVCGATWDRGIRRIPQAMARLIPLTGSVLIVVLAVRMSHFGWHHPGDGDPGTFWFKQMWLEPPFWLVRAVIYIVVWSLLATLVVGGRQTPDAIVPTGRSDRMVRRSAWFLAVFAVTFSLATVDWLMALEPLWSSTMWGVYCFAGMTEATLAAMIVVGLTFRTGNESLQHIVRQEQLYDLGQLLLGFACFWMYIWFCQFMLIWYANLPEETSYFVLRTRSGWGPVVLVAIMLNWLIPFLLLLPKPAKQNPDVMMRVAIVALVGRWVDLYVIVFPSMFGEGPVFGIWELAAMACCIGLAGILIGRCLGAPQRLVSAPGKC